jgi:hypothetical protein
MRYHEITLTEKRAAPLYHWLDNEKAHYMLTHDAMLGKWDHYMPIEGQSFQGNSFTRNSKLNLEHCKMRITVDQGKLASRFKIMPTDGNYVFHSSRARKDSKDGNVDMSRYNYLRDRTYSSSEAYNFAEEFVVGDITNIHLYITEMFVDNLRYVFDEEQIQEYCTKYGIKLVMKAPPKRDNDYDDDE